MELDFYLLSSERYLSGEGRFILDCLLVFFLVASDFFMCIDEPSILELSFLESKSDVYVSDIDYEEEEKLTFVGRSVPV